MSKITIPYRHAGVRDKTTYPTCAPSPLRRLRYAYTCPDKRFYLTRPRAFFPNPCLSNIPKVSRTYGSNRRFSYGERDQPAACDRTPRLEFCPKMRDLAWQPHSSRRKSQSNQQPPTPGWGLSPRKQEQSVRPRAYNVLRFCFFFFFFFWL